MRNKATDKVSTILLILGIGLIFYLFTLVMGKLSPSLASLVILLIPGVALALRLRCRSFWPVAKVQNLLTGILIASGALALALAFWPQGLRDAVALASAVATGILVRQIRQKDGDVLEYRQGIGLPGMRERIRERAGLPALPKKIGSIFAPPSPAMNAKMDANTRPPVVAPPRLSARPSTQSGTLDLVALYQEALITLLLAVQGDLDGGERVRTLLQTHLRCDRRCQSRIRKMVKTAKTHGINVVALAGACREQFAYAPRLAMLDLALHLSHQRTPPQAGEERQIRAIALDLGIAPRDLRSIEARYLPGESAEEEETRLALERVRRHQEEKERLLRNWQDLQWQQNPQAGQRKAEIGPGELRALALLGLEPEAGMTAVREAREQLLEQYQPDKLRFLGEEFVRLAAAHIREIEAAVTYLEERREAVR